jgi:DNA-binding transcriptional LysR family regulator
MLGTPLLERGRRGVAPTVAGQALLEHARNVMFTLGRIEAETADLSSNVQGQVRLVASASAIAQSLPDDIATFLRDPAHRAIRVDVEERHSADVLRMVRDGGAALGVCWNNLDAGSLAMAAYRHDELALAVHPDHPLAQRRSVRYVETLDYEQVGLPPSSAVTRLLEQTAAHEGRRVLWRVVVSSIDAAFRVVAAGLAISVLPTHIGDLHRKHSGLRLVPIADPWAQRQFSILFKERSSLSMAAQLMLDHLSRCTD